MHCCCSVWPGSGLDSRLVNRSHSCAVVVAIGEEVLADEHPQPRPDGAGEHHDDEHEHCAEEEDRLDALAPASAEVPDVVAGRRHREQVQTAADERDRMEHDPARDDHAGCPLAAPRDGRPRRAAGRAGSPRPRAAQRSGSIARNRNASEKSSRSNANALPSASSSGFRRQPTCSGALRSRCSMSARPKIVTPRSATSPAIPAPSAWNASTARRGGDIATAAAAATRPSHASHREPRKSDHAGRASADDDPKNVASRANHRPARRRSSRRWAVHQDSPPPVANATPATAQATLAATAREQRAGLRRQTSPDCEEREKHGEAGCRQPVAPNADRR